MLTYISRPLISFFFPSIFCSETVSIVSLCSSFWFWLLFKSLFDWFQKRKASTYYTKYKHTHPHAAHPRRIHTHDVYIWSKKSGAFVSNHLFNFMVQWTTLCKISLCLARTVRALKTSSILTANIRIKTMRMTTTTTATATDEEEEEEE